MTVWAMALEAVEDVLPEDVVAEDPVVPVGGSARRGMGHQSLQLRQGFSIGIAAVGHGGSPVRVEVVLGAHGPEDVHEHVAPAPLTRVLSLCCTPLYL